VCWRRTGVSTSSMRRRFFGCKRCADARLPHQPSRGSCIASKRQQHVPAIKARAVRVGGDIHELEAEARVKALSVLAGVERDLCYPRRGGSSRQPCMKKCAAQTCSVKLTINHAPTQVSSRAVLLDGEASARHNTVIPLQDLIRPVQRIFLQKSNKLLPLGRGKEFRRVSVEQSQTFRLVGRAVIADTVCGDISFWVHVIVTARFRSSEAVEPTVSPGRASCVPLWSGGWGEIRTPETLSRPPVFKTGAINHSATHPDAARSCQRKRRPDRGCVSPQALLENRGQFPDLLLRSARLAPCRAAVQSHQGKRIVEPVVLRFSRASCALAASASG
jgi:hypothetical protein